MSTVKLAVSTSVILTVYFLMTPFCWLMGGGVQERIKEIELTFAAIKSSGGALGAEKEIIIVCSAQKVTKENMIQFYSFYTHKSYHLERSAVSGQEKMGQYPHLFLQQQCSSRLCREKMCSVLE